MSRNARGRLAWFFFMDAVASSFGMSGVHAEPAPRFIVRHEIWKSSTGRCTSDVAYVGVSGVREDVRARVDAILKQQVAILSLPQTAVIREAQCARERHARRAYLNDDSYHGFERVDWTVGMARGRWLSVRLHYTEYSGAFQAHPIDYYKSTTFDLQHGGFPVPTSGYYRRSQRAHLDDALAHGAVTALGIPSTYLDSKRRLAAEATVGDGSIIVTQAGIEVTGLGENESERQLIVKVPYSGLAGVGTPGGPLDPATR